jgi:oligo-1,6-glucosidase
MQWTDEVYAGFSTVEPIQKVNRNTTWLNVKAQEEDEQSILNHYRRLIHLRKNPEYLETLVFGDFELLDPKNPDVYAFTRTSSQKKITVIANFRASTVQFEHQAKSVCLSNYLDTQLTITELRPYEAIVFED